MIKFKQSTNLEFREGNMLVPEIPNNSLTKEINEIVYVAVKLEGVNL